MIYGNFRLSFSTIEEFRVLWILLSISLNSRYQNIFHFFFICLCLYCKGIEEAVS